MVPLAAIGNNKRKMTSFMFILISATASILLRLNHFCVARSKQISEQLCHCYQRVIGYSLYTVHTKYLGLGVTVSENTKIITSKKYIILHTHFPIY